MQTSLPTSFGINAQTQIRPGTITPELLHPDLAAQLGGGAGLVSAALNVTYLSQMQPVEPIEQYMNGDQTLTDQRLTDLLPYPESQTTTFAEGETFAFYGVRAQGWSKSLWIATRLATDSWQVSESTQAANGERYFWVQAAKGNLFKVGLATLAELTSDVSREAVERRIQAQSANLLAQLDQRTLSLTENNTMYYDHQPISLDRQTFPLGDVQPVGQIAVNVNGVRLNRSQYLYDTATRTVTLGTPIGQDDVLTVDFYGHPIYYAM